MWANRRLVVLAALSLLLAACGGAQEEETPPEEAPARTLEARPASIIVDGDPSDWEGVKGLDLMLEAIAGEELESKSATVKAAHDDEFIYVLLEVTDDFNWSADDAHLSGSAAVEWASEATAGEAMGAEEPDRVTSLGMVDIWHWELECAAGAESGGEVSDPGEGADPGDDGACNLDDEWATTPSEREDDNGEGAENSLLGVWSHTNATEDGEGTWVFEMRRPLATGDAQDAQLTVGETALLALAYWDPDNGDAGWGDEEHVQSGNQGWIEVTLA
jgi:hypothetical protein